MPVTKIVADVARKNEFAHSYFEVPHLTVGSYVRGRCEPVHISGRKSLRPKPAPWLAQRLC